MDNRVKQKGSSVCGKGLFLVVIIVACLTTLLCSCTRYAHLSYVEKSDSAASAASAQIASSGSSVLTFEPRNLDHATVVRVVDGDTLVVRLDDGTENSTRLIGIDCPESVNPDESLNTVEGDVASEYVKSIIHEGTDVWLEKDVSDVDKYGRWLRYVWMHNPDTTDITFDLGTLNSHLVYYGYAHAKDYPPDTAHAATLHTLESAPIAPDTTVPIGPLKQAGV